MKKEVLKKIADDNNGYLFTADVLCHDISKTYMANFVKENGYERVGHGIYAAPDVWPDELYLLQKANPKIVFSGETALYIHGLTDREYQRIEVTVPKGYNAVHLRKKHIKVRTMKDELYEMGKTMVESGYGNMIIVYDQERTICDTIINRKKMDVQIFQAAIKEYMAVSDRKLQVLVRYAEKLGVRDEVMKYVEVLT
ncbi:putative transcriptional regulator of viral defense system [Lachnospiraceae bacterium PF1-21]|uniref:type IV toxin-antitoxin system AbiEi family antitoxin domain-containing protein n=1 Tax=Ohessyouella blattaphilus TaxID=2949333 RepID=UPI003E2859B1